MPAAKAASAVENFLRVTPRLAIPNSLLKPRAARSIRVHAGAGEARPRVSCNTPSHPLLDDAGAHVVLDQPPDVIDVAHELGRALDREPARSRQLDDDVLAQASRPARENEHAVRQKYRLVDL